MVYYVANSLFLLGLLALATVLLLKTELAWLRLLDAALLAFVFTHCAYLIHDAGHRQILGRPWQNDWLMLFFGALVGSSRTWWFETHNQHHSNPNNLDLDPNTALPILAFSERQARGRQGLLRVITRFQAFYFFPLLSLEAIGIRVASIRGLFSGETKYLLAESAGMLLHLVLYAGFLFYVMPPVQAIFFILVHQGLTGLYLGLVFAPNHNGMPVADPAAHLDFLHRQILSSRNIAASPLTDFLFGGLNYQIEHHLFPTIPRNKLKQAQTIVRDFCKALAIPYHETSVVRAYWEVTRYFHRMAAPLRDSGKESGDSGDLRWLLSTADQVVPLTTTHVERVEVASQPGTNVTLGLENASAPRLSRPTP